MTKKIILFLVEGPTDEDALALVYSKLVREHDLEFDVLHTDITAGEDMTVKYIADWIQAEVAEYLRRHPYIVKEDILKVVQIIDTDGAFIPTSQICQSDTGKTEYFDTYIAAKNKDRLIRRNISKRRIVYHLMKSEEVAGFSYEIYYFSRNLEHVLHDISEDLDDDAKEDLAYEIAMRYKDQPEEFLQFLFVAVTEERKPLAFMGAEDGKLEMLFVTPKERSKGIGKLLFTYGIKNCGINCLTVNEQNPQAIGFYEHMGFQTYKRTDMDEQGNPYPLLYMRLGQKKE